MCKVDEKTYFCKIIRVQINLKYIHAMKTNLFTRLALCCAFVFSLTTAAAQTPEPDSLKDSSTTAIAGVDYCTTYMDLLTGRWSHADSVEVITKSRSKQAWRGGADFHFDSDKAEVEKLFKNKVVAVKYRDTLLVNCTKFKDRGTKFGKGYVRALWLKDSSLVVLYCNVAKISARNMTGAMFGLVGALAVAGKSVDMAKHNVCYVFHPGNFKLEIVDEKLLPKMLQDRQDLIDEYQQVDKKQRLNAEVVLPLLRKAGWLRE